MGEATVIGKNRLRAWRTLSRKGILNYSKYLKIEEHAILLPDGEMIHDWPWIITPDAVIVLPRLKNGNFLVFRQRKYAIDGISYAPVGGMLEPRERPLLAAKRELLEEMGCQAEKWIHLSSSVIDANHGVAKIHLYLALNAKQVADPVNDDLEDQEVMTLDLAELTRALLSGKFKEITWIAGVSLALNYLSP